MARRYLAIIKVGNDAGERFRKKVEHWSDDITAKEAAKDAEPFVDAIREVDNQLLRVNWDAETAADVKEFVRANAGLVGDLVALANVDALSVGDWSNQVAQDFAKANAAANIVRADLGLPPTS